MKGRSFVILGLVLALLLGFFLYKSFSREEVYFEEDSIKLYKDKDGSLNLSYEDREKNLGSIDEPKVSLSRKKRFMLIEKDSLSLIIDLENNLELLEFKDIEGPVFSPDEDSFLLAGKSGDDSYDLVLFYPGSDKLETLLEGDKGDKIIPLSWEGDLIEYKLINGEKEGIEKLNLAKTKEDYLVDLLRANGDYREVLDLLEEVDFDKLKSKYGQNILSQTYDWLAGKNIKEEKDMVSILSLDRDYDGNDHYSYMNLLASLYLRDIESFSKALIEYPVSPEKIGYGFNDIRLYEREGTDLFEDIKKVLHSKKLSQLEKDLTLKLINTYSSCGG